MPKVHELNEVEFFELRASGYWINVLVPKQAGLTRAEGRLYVQESWADRAEGPLYVPENWPDRAESPLYVHMEPFAKRVENAS